MTVRRGHWVRTLLLSEKSKSCKKKVSPFILFVFYFSRPEHCGPFIHQCHIKYRTKRWLLPKFDSKILIKWSNTGSASGASVNGPLVMDPHPAIGVSTKKFQKNRRSSFLRFFLFLNLKVSDDTRSAWRYCKTRATLGQGAAQAPQDLSRGLNNSLKLMWRHAPRTRD